MCGEPWLFAGYTVFAAVASLAAAHFLPETYQRDITTYDYRTGAETPGAAHTVAASRS